MLNQHESAACGSHDSNTEQFKQNVYKKYVLKKLYYEKKKTSVVVWNKFFFKKSKYFDVMNFLILNMLLKIENDT